MSKLNYEEIYKYTKNYLNDIKSSEKKTTQENLQTQINNANTKLASKGLDTVDTDTRNGLEKFLGLTENQGIIGDVFEILGRPQQALFGGIKAGAEGEDVLEGAWEHLKGEDYTSGKDLIKSVAGEDTFVDRSDPEALAEAGIVGLPKYMLENTDPIDVYGFLLDVLADPIDLPIAIATAGSSAAVTGTADALRAGSKAVDAIDTASDIAKATGALSDASKVVNTADAVSDATKVLNKGKTVRKSVSDLLFEGTGKAIKGGAKLADTSVEKLLTKIDDAADIVYDTPKALKAANLGKKLRTVEDGVEVLTKTDKTGSLELYKDFKDSINMLFNNGKRLSKPVKDAINSDKVAQVKTAKELRAVRDNYVDNLNTYARRMFDNLSDSAKKKYKNVDDFVDKVDRDIANLKEFMNLDREVTVGKLLKEAQQGTLTAEALGDEGLELIREVADDVNLAGRGYDLTVSITDDGLIKLSDEWDELLDNNPNVKKKVELDPKKLEQKLTKKSAYTSEDLDYLSKLLKDYNRGMGKTNNKNSKLFTELYNKSDNIFNLANEIVNRNFGVKIAEKGDNLGYVRHAYNDTFSNILKGEGIRPSGLFKGDSSVLSDRTYNMSIREANNLFKEQLTKNYDTLSPSAKAYVDKLAGKGGIFKEGMLASFDDYLKNIPKNASDSKKIDNILVRSTFGQYEDVTKLDGQIREAYRANDMAKANSLKAAKASILDNSSVKILVPGDNTIPLGFEKIEGDALNNLIKKMRRLGDQYNIDELGELATFLKTQKGAVTVDKEVLRLLKIVSDTHETKGLVRLYDMYLNTFKKFKVLSPTFQMNNIVGNMSNMFLAGISPTDQARLYPQAMEVLKKGDGVYDKALKEGVESLSKSERKIHDVWSEFIEAGFGDVNSLTAMELQDMPDSLKRYFRGDKKFENAKDIIVDGLPYINNKMNNYMDTTSRLVTFMKGKEDASFLNKLGVDSAADAVRKVNFDATDLTTFEQNTMKRVMPFYTFAKKNLAFQIDNLSKNGSQYHKLFKTYNSLLDSATGGNVENVEEWLKNNMYMPIPALGKDGSYRVIRATLPAGSMNELFADPLGFGVSLMTPALKIPFELATNINSFTGAPIENFEGELSKNLPMTKKQEYLLGNLTGLDVPLKGVNKFYKGYMDSIENNGNFGDAISNALNKTLTLESNIETDKTNRMYEQLEDVENTIKQYEQQDYVFGTINELKQANNANKKARDEINVTYNKIYGSKSSKDPYKNYLDSLDTTNNSIEDLWRLYGIQ